MMVFRKGNLLAIVIWEFSSITFVVELMKLRISQVNCKVGGKLDGPSGATIAVHQSKCSWQAVTSAISQGSIPGQYFLTSLSTT